MGTLKQKLNEIAQQIKKGVTPAPVTVREILGWFGASRRGSFVNWSIRQALEEVGLETQPEFDWAYIDGQIKFVAIGSKEDRQDLNTIYRIDGLESANRKPVSVKPDSLLSGATTLMLANDFSQLPVMTTDREVKGAITWKSIGTRLSLGQKFTLVRECMDSAKLIPADSSLFDAIKIISDHDYVLVQAQDKTICGIVTSSDLSQQFKDLAEPFLLIGECENLLRRLVHGKFSVEELTCCMPKDPNDPDRTVTAVADLTFGAYVRLFEDPNRWNKLALSLDRNKFIEMLDRARQIRNDTMHFDPQGIDPKEMQFLQDFTRFLKQLRSLGAI